MKVKRGFRAVSTIGKVADAVVAREQLRDPQKCCAGATDGAMCSLRFLCVSSRQAVLNTDRLFLLGKGTVLSNSDTRIRVVVVDDFEPWRQRIRSILQTWPELHIVAESAD